MFQNLHFDFVFVICSLGAHVFSAQQNCAMVEALEWDMVIFCHLCARTKMNQGGAKLVGGRCLQLLGVAQGLCRDQKVLSSLERTWTLWSSEARSRCDNFFRAFQCQRFCFVLHHNAFSSRSLFPPKLNLNIKLLSNIKFIFTRSPTSQSLSCLDF